MLGRLGPMLLVTAGFTFLYSFIPNTRVQLWVAFVAGLAAAAALVSSLVNAPLPTDAVYFGEISLSGAVRPVAQAPARLKEALKLGFAKAVTPQGRGEGGGIRVNDGGGSRAGGGGHPRS